MVDTVPRRPIPPKLRRVLRRAALLAVVGALVAGVTTAAAGWWVRSEADGHLHTAESVPPAPVALVLGALVYADGTPSPFLAARLDLARRLYETGKVRAILVSGDHMHWEYDEPSAMRDWLVRHGVPSTKIVLDYAGFDTYDSCSRAKRIFGVTQATVVTQSFHLARAVAVCRRLGVDAAGVGDDTVARFRVAWLRSSTREHGAAIKAALDVLSGRDPVHLGRRETGVDEALRD